MRAAVYARVSTFDQEPENQLRELRRYTGGARLAERHYPRWHPWTLCDLRTGLRLGELLALQWADIDWNGRFLAVQRNLVRGLITSPKSHQQRKVDLTPHVVTALQTWRRVQRARWFKKGKPMPEWVFPSRTGTSLEHCNVRQAFGRLLERAGLRQIRIHDLRHTYATLLLQAGAPITYVSHQLGHRDASITLRVYAHWLSGGLQRAADRLDTLHPDATPAQPDAKSSDESSAASSLDGVVSPEGIEPSTYRLRVCCSAN
jgi:integrase